MEVFCGPEALVQIPYSSSHMEVVGAIHRSFGCPSTSTGRDVVASPPGARRTTYDPDVGLDV